MTCPHCQANLLRKERTNSVCAHCRKPFALDPRVHGLGMNDLRIRRRAQQVTQEGRLRVTLAQFWYLARSANPEWKGIPPRRTPLLSGWLAAGTVSVALIVATAALPADQDAKWLATVLLCLFLCTWAARRRQHDHSGYPPGARVDPSYTRFRQLIAVRWVQVYGALPPGIVDEEEFAAPVHPVARPEAALLCPDRAVTVFLAANDIPQRLNLVVVATAAQLPAKVPVVVLHDASARGALLASQTRAALPGRVVIDAGLSPHTARTRKIVRLLDSSTEVSSELLRTSAGLPAALADWLAQGWWCPLAAVPPARLEAVVVRAVRRAVEQGRIAADPQHRRVATAGFMTWPASAGGTPQEGRAI